MFKKITLSISVAIILSIQSLSAPVFANTLYGAETCQPANLNQALTLGLGWSQFGVTNNATSGSFFIICPLHLDNEYDSFDTIRLEMQYLSPIAANITCTALTVEIQGAPANPVNGSLALNVDPNPGSQVGQFASTDTSSLTPGLGSDKAVMICALPAQTRLVQIGITGS